ncbi:MAG TPA: EamA family transporter [Saprospiraceae bacterium]|nr:EamA family transporter [Saprospiraceae bacterium]
MKDTQAKATLALILVCLIWGTTYLVNKMGVSRVPPLFFTSVRQLVAGGIILTYTLLIKKWQAPNWQEIKQQVLLAVLLISIGNGVGTYGLQYIDSGLSAIIAAISPIIIALLTLSFNPDDRLKPLGWLGTLMGFSGVLWICFHKNTGGESTWFGVFLTILSVLAWGVGTVLNKNKKTKTSPFVNAGIHMIIGAIPIVILSLITEDLSSVQIPTKVYFIWAYLIFLGSIVAYSSYIFALKYLPATVVSIQSYVNPIIAVILGAIVLKEQLSFSIAIACFITLIGIFLVNISIFRK